MQIISVNRRVQLESLSFHGKTIESGINKQSTDEPVLITPDGLEGDCIGDLRVHGGEFKAVYSYAGEHYEFWRGELQRPGLPFGAFGENLTTQGFDEAMVHIGDRFQFGEAILQATEPRMPCRTMGMNFQDMGMIRRFLNEGRMGIYYKVIQPGLVKNGDVIKPLQSDPDHVPLSEIVRLYTVDTHDTAALERVLQVASLPPGWREAFEEQLAEANAD